MKNITRFQIRKDWQELNEAIARMDEKFIKQDDPSMSVMNFIEQVSKSLTSIKSKYTQSADDRNRIIQPVLDDLKTIEARCAELRASLIKIASGEEDPEDVNKGVED